MSNSLAISAVTATLRNLLTQGVQADLPDATVTTRPPDKARNNNTGNQINLFLYQTLLNAAWLNMDMPRQTKPGETGHPPLALNLYYLITAYGASDDDGNSHRLLGRAMSVLHDHPLLDADEIQAALAGSDLHQQVERVRITPQPLSLEELSKLWTTFQTQYRISAAYQVAVVLIESTRPARTPLPVLTRGPDDSGPVAQADVIPPFPTIEQIILPQNQTSAQLNDQLIIEGHHLAGEVVMVRLTTTRLPTPRDIVVPAADRSDTQIKVRWPNEPANLPAGFYTLSVTIMPAGKPAEARATNEAPILLAPKITSAMPMNVARVNVNPQTTRGDATINLTCSPEVRAAQRVTLGLGDHEVIADAHPTQTNALTFNVKQIGAGEYRVRLRVDGVDSPLVDRTDPQKPKFDETQKVTLT